MTLFGFLFGDSQLNPRCFKLHLTFEKTFACGHTIIFPNVLSFYIHLPNCTFMHQQVETELEFHNTVAKS